MAMGTSDVYDTINFIMAGAGGGIGRTKTPVHARVCVCMERAHSSCRTGVSNFD